MKNCEILIIGAGATGLMAARTLARAGKKVTVLEARDRCGGRIHTINQELFFRNAELGAEFIHGDLPVTLNLLKDAGIAYHHAGGRMWHYKNGKFMEEDEPTEGWDLLLDKLEELQTDITIEGFLQKEFPEDKYDGLKNSVRRFVSGYDTADPSLASSFALRSEWGNEDEGAQHRIKGGYGVMINYLEDETKAAGGSICLNSIVKEIQWENGKAKAFTGDGAIYEADKILIALPLGILKADKSQKAAINVVPAISTQQKAIDTMGFGAIIKILLEFDEPFWEDEQATALAGKSLKNMAFLLSHEEIPTWWTQAPQHSTVLTGWLGGPPALAKKDLIDHELLEQSLQSLANIFKRDIVDLKNKLVAFNIVNWTTDPFTLGSYAYDTIAAPASRKVLSMPIDNTIYFAGEYLYEGPAMGTVEAALTSGKEVAERILGG
jgi:monoamine oxidase